MSSPAPAPDAGRVRLTATHWGTYRAVPGEGGAVRLEGLPIDPAPSPIGGSMLAARTGPLRIARPMVRRAYLESGPACDRERRGRDGFVAVSWGDALDLVARELERVRAAHGFSAIYAGSYGWASAGRFHHAQSQLKRFFRRFGGATFSRDTYSYAAAEVILPHVVAPLGKLLIEHTSWQAIADGARLVVAFGGMAARNAQVNAGGLGAHTQGRDMRAARAAGVCFVNVGPDASDTAAALEADWIAIRPGSDLALMLGLAHTLVMEGLHDAAFLETHTVGFDRFHAYLTGARDGTAKDADWAAALCGIEATRVRALARRMAREATVVNVSWSLTRQENGESIYWMAVVLAAMLGGIGRPGQGFALGLGAVNGVGGHRAHLPCAALPSGPPAQEDFIPVARIRAMLANPGGVYRYNGRERRYPDIRLIYWAGGNPFHHHQDLNALRAAWAGVETVVVHEQVWTATARQADIVLPVTMGLERNDICASPRDGHLIYSSRIFEPFGEARNDHDIFAALARRVRAANAERAGFEAAFTEGRDEAAWLETLYEQTRRRGRELGFDLPSFEAFKDCGVVRLPDPNAPRTLLRAFRADPEANALPTPSGRIEIFSATVAGFGLADLPGHPAWRPPSEWLGAAGTADFPLHLVSHQPSNKLHSQLDHGPLAQANKTDGREPCRMNPKDAAARGIDEGDIVRVRNARGSCLAVARLDDRLMAGVVKMATGAWYDPDWDGDPNTCKHGNVNVLTPDRPTSDLAQGPAALGCLVDVLPCTGAPPASALDPPEME